MELFIEQIDNEILRDKKKKKAEGYSVERRGDRRAAESQCYRHITNKREGHIFTKSSQTLGKREQSEPVVRRPIYFYKKMWYYIYGD